MRRKFESGFSLIEMMFVILIIMLLSGILLKISSLVTQKAARTRTIADLENIQNALNEYYSEYGSYPPTDQTRYVYESATNQPSYLQQYLAANNDPDQNGFVPDMDGRPAPYNNPSGLDVGYEYGLVSYLYNRRQGDQRHWYDWDTPRDERAKQSWAHYLEDVHLYRDGVPMVMNLLNSTQDYTNGVATIIDPWGREYRYRSSSPYSTYELWSNGPDGQEGTGDDIRNDGNNE